MLPYVVKINSKRNNFTLYIGREFGGLPQSKWHNPYHAWMHSMIGCIKLYENDIRDNEELMAAIPELSDQVLGCWCYPEACHGDVLVKIYKEVCKPNMGDMAQAVNMHGDLILPEPLEVTSIMGQEGFGQPSKRWVQLSGQLGWIPEEQVVWP
jgi:hypothetical protein